MVRRSNMWTETCSTGFQPVPRCAPWHGLKTRATWMLVAAFLFTGCASSYVTPGRPADMQRVGVPKTIRDASTDGVVQQALDKKPLARFPTGIAVVRVQAPGYQSNTAQGFGSGAFCVVTTRDIEKPEQIERLSKLPMVSGIAPVNRLLLTQELQSDLQLREAAAHLQAQMLLIYTLDTQ